MYIWLSLEVKFYKAENIKIFMIAAQSQNPREMSFEYLLEHYGTAANISPVNVKKMGMRYRHKPNPKYAGEFIAREKARSLLELECEKQLNNLSLSDL